VIVGSFSSGRGLDTGARGRIVSCKTRLRYVEFPYSYGNPAADVFGNRLILFQLLPLASYLLPHT